MRIILFLASAAVLSLAMLPSQSPVRRKQATAIRDLQSYKSWHLVTPKAIDMAPSIATSCIGPAIWHSSPKNPHVRTLYKVYVNATGRAAMLSKNLRTPFPVGSMILKEKFEVAPRTPSDSFRWRQPVKGAKPVLLTGMIKREKGFSTATSDWEYVVLTGDGREKTSEGLQHCASCHETQKKRDYVFREYGSVRGGEDPFREFRSKVKPQ